MHPLIGLALGHPEQPPRHDWQGRGVQVDQDTQHAILLRWQGTIVVGRLPAGGPRGPIDAPLGPRRLARCVKGRDQRLKLLHGEAGQIQHRRGVGLDRAAAYTSHGGGLLSGEAEETINRNKLYLVRIQRRDLQGHKTGAKVSHLAISINKILSTR